MAEKARKKDTKSIGLPPRRPGWFDRLVSLVPRRNSALLASCISLIALFPFTSSVQTVNLPKEGDVARETVIAPFTFDIPKSPAELEKERVDAMSQVLLVLDYNGDMELKVRHKYLELREWLATIVRADTSDSLRKQVTARLEKQFSQKTLRVLARRPYLIDDALFQSQTALRGGLLAVLLVPSVQDLADLQKQYNVSFDQHLVYKHDFVTLRRDSAAVTMKRSDLPVKEMVLENITRKLKTERGFDEEALNALYEVLFAYLQPNVTVNGEETARRQQMASMQVLPIKGKVIKDTEIMRKHQVVTAEMVEKLGALKLALQKRMSGGEQWKVLASNGGKAVLVIVLLVFAAYYLARVRPEVLRSGREAWAMATIIIVQAAVVRLSLMLLPQVFRGVEISSLVPEYATPLIVAPILAAIFFDFEVSAVAAVFFSAYYGLVLGFKFPPFLFALLGGMMAGFTHRNIRYRWDFFRAMPPVAAVYVVFILLWHVIVFDFSMVQVVQNLGLGLINLIVATFLAMMLVAAFENLFGISTNMTLVELADMNHPILKRLSIEAPGTYNHSVLVGNLAESAAETIGANALLARVASYYHDIGKIEKSDYFVENLVGDRNVHNKLAPSMSALIICSHVKDGLDLARKYKLPRVIQDSIAQHHGTSRVSFFYEKAKELDPHNQVQEADFRYPGPTPQTRENAVIMLADSIEAASRSLSTSSPKLLRELVRKIIRDKFTARQLDQCNLTLRDLDRIVDGFMPVLQGIFHSRIEYPTK